MLLLIREYRETISEEGGSDSECILFLPGNPENPWRWKMVVTIALKSFLGFLFFYCRITNYKFRGLKQFPFIIS